MHLRSTVWPSNLVQIPLRKDLSFKKFANSLPKGCGVLWHFGFLHYSWADSPSISEIRSTCFCWASYLACLCNLNFGNGEGEGRGRKGRLENIGVVAGVNANQDGLFTSILSIIDDHFGILTDPIKKYLRLGFLLIRL